MKRFDTLFYMGKPFLTDFIGGKRIWHISNSIYEWLPEAVRIMQVTMN